MQHRPGLMRDCTGHGATVHAATIQDGALVGMGATVLDGCTVSPWPCLAHTPCCAWPSLCYSLSLQCRSRVEQGQTVLEGYGDRSRTVGLSCSLLFGRVDAHQRAVRGPGLWRGLLSRQRRDQLTMTLTKLAWAALWCQGCTPFPAVLGGLGWGV